MKSLSIITSILITLVVLLSLTACSEDEGDMIFDEIVAQVSDGETTDESIEVLEEPKSANNDDEIPPSATSDLSEILTILTDEIDTHLPYLAERFMSEHPDVQIEIERLGFFAHSQDISHQIALTTRLLADPPDIFNTAYFVFEKFAMDAVFVDLNEFIDGPSGIDRSNYFDNILRGAEIDGSLYHLPMMVDMDTILPNKRLFESISKSTANMRAITLDEYLAFYLMAVDANPDESLLVANNFNIMHIFKFEQVYDIEAGVVNANTPKMQELLTLAHSIPTGRLVQFTPSYVAELFSGNFGANSQVMDFYFDPTVNFMYDSHSGLLFPHVFFLQDHPDMQFGTPMHRMPNTGEVRFRSTISPAILRESPNRDLAWEFIRFAMEYPNAIVTTLGRDYLQQHAFPVNKTMFESHLFYYLNTAMSTLIWTESLDKDVVAPKREEMVAYAIYRYTELVQMLTTEVRYNQATLNSIIYPDIYLFITDRQDVYQTLANIQNRLEIYIAE